LCRASPAAGIRSSRRERVETRELARGLEIRNTELRITSERSPSARLRSRERLRASLFGPCCLRRRPFAATLSVVRSDHGTRGSFGLVAILALACSLQNPSYSSTSSGSSTSGSSTSASSTTTTEGEACPSDRCNYLDPSPIACYEFEDPNELTDDTECGYNGTILSVSAVSGAHAQGIRVTDNSEIIADGKWPDFPSFTVSSWIALRDGAADSEDFTLFIKGTQFKLSLQHPVPPDALSWRLFCSIGKNAVTSDSPPLNIDGKWHLVGCGCAKTDTEGSCAEIFAFTDKSRYLGNEFLKNPLMLNSDLEIAPDFDGCIDSVQIWDRALTGDETLALYNAGREETNMDCKGD